MFLQHIGLFFKDKPMCVVEIRCVMSNLKHVYVFSTLQSVINFFNQQVTVTVFHPDTKTPQTQTICMTS